MIKVKIIAAAMRGNLYKLLDVSNSKHENKGSSTVFDMQFPRFGPLDRETIAQAGNLVKSTSMVF